MAFKDPERKRAYQRAYDHARYAANPQKARAKTRLYIEQNREIVNRRAREKYNTERQRPELRAQWAAQTRAWNRRNPAPARANKLKARIFELLGRACVLCGFADERVLQIDHIGGGGRKARRENKGLPVRVKFYRYVLRSLMLGENKFRILCANCNHIDARSRLFISENVRQARRNLLKEMGNRCVRCACAEYEALHIDHVHDDGHKTWGSRGGSRLLYFKIIRQQPDRFQLLCANCNWLKRLESKSGQLEAA